MKILIILFIIILNCNVNYNPQKIKIRGIWIPQKVNWKNGGFSNYYFGDDSSVIIISSIQKKIRDSIYFQAEPGFDILKGFIKSVSKTKSIISYKPIYRFIKLPDDDINKILTDTLDFLSDNNNIRQILINKVPYYIGTAYTQQSKNAIVSIATKMVADIEKHPEHFN